MPATRKNRELRPRGGRVSASIVTDVLLLVGENKSDVKRWSQRDRERVYDWAIRTHLRASDNVIAVPDRPRVLDA